MMMTQILGQSLAQLLQFAVVLLLAPLLTGFIRKAKARLTARQGPSVLQPYRDVLRLLKKEAIVPTRASWLFRVAPYIGFIATWLAASLVPTFISGLVLERTADLIALVGLLAMVRFVTTLAALDGGAPFGGLGMSRDLMIAALAEPALMMVIFTAALLAGSTEPAKIATFMTSGGMGLQVSVAMGGIALVMVALAETGRVPLDNPATHLELTMVHEAMILEYSGRHLALIELTRMMQLFLYISLILCLFLPFGMAAAGSGVGAWGVGLLAFGGKMALLAGCLAFFETSLAKMRVFRVPEFLGAALLIGVLAGIFIFVTGVVLP
jgi:formate hydrogenlyase subunit 4